MKQKKSEEQIALNNKRNRREFINAFKKSIGEFRFQKDYDYLEDFPYSDFLNIYKKNSVMVILDNYIKYINGISYSANNKRMIKKILNHILPIQAKNMSKKEINEIMDKLDIISNDKFNSIDLNNLKEIIIKNVKKTYSYKDLKEFIIMADYLKLSTYETIFEDDEFLNCYSKLQNQEKEKLKKLMLNRLCNYNVKQIKKIINILIQYKTSIIDPNNIIKTLSFKIPSDKKINNNVKDIIKVLESDKMPKSSKLIRYRKMIIESYNNNELNFNQIEYLFKLLDSKIKYVNMYNMISKTSFSNEESLKKLFYNNFMDNYNELNIREKETIKNVIIEKIKSYGLNKIKKIKEILYKIDFNFSDFINIDDLIFLLEEEQINKLDFEKELNNVRDYIYKSNYISVSAYDNTTKMIELLYKRNYINEDIKKDLLLALKDKIIKYKSIGFNLLNDDEGKITKKEFINRVNNNHKYDNNIINSIILPQNNRNDFTNLDIFTIDKSVSMDLDDALSIERLSNGTFNVYIIISDPTNLLRSNRFLYDEILKREESYYYTDGRNQIAINMYPDYLAENYLSIIPNKITNAHILKLNMTKDGEVLSYNIIDGIVKSKERFTYTAADQIIKEGSNNKKREQMLKDLYEISKNFNYTISYNKADEMVANLSTFTNYFISKLFKDKGLPYISLYSEETSYDSRACYSAIASGHYHLGLSSYTHYTSPIRRAADSYMHDLVRTFFVDKQLDDKTVYENEEKIKQIVPLINKGRNEINYINK